MIKRNSNIIFIIFAIISIVELLMIFNIIKINDAALLQKINAAYTFFALIIAFIFLKNIIKLEESRPKEEVKIIYKNFDREKADKEIIEKKTSDKAEKLAASFIEGLEEFKTKEQLTEAVLTRLSKNFHIVQGIFFLWNEKDKIFTTANTYAYYSEDTDKKFTIGEGITGQVAKNKKFLLIDNVPKDYINVVSGLGDGSPKYLAFLPIIHNDRTIAVIEFASFSKFPEPTEKIFTVLAEKLKPFVVKILS